MKFGLGMCQMCGRPLFVNQDGWVPCTCHATKELSVSKQGIVDNDGKPIELTEAWPHIRAGEQLWWVYT